MPLRTLLVFIFVLACSSPVQAKHLYPEKVYQNKWCSANNGQSEYHLDTGCRVDCLTSQYAIEFDFASKVYEGIGQAMYYSSKTGKAPGVVLIMENPETEQSKLNKLKSVSAKYGIKYWIMTPSDLK